MNLKLITKNERISKVTESIKYLWMLLCEESSYIFMLMLIVGTAAVMSFFLQRILNSVFFSREMPCKVYLLCYSAITQAMAMENLKNRQLMIQIDFVNTLKEADIVISELELPHRETPPAFICFVNSPFDYRDWMNIENMIIKWRISR